MIDARLVGKAKRGNSLAFIQLIEQYQNSLYCTALSILGSSWDAYDVLQETLLKAYESLPLLKDNGSFKSWLTRILINGCHDHFRKNKKVVLVDSPQDTGYEFTGPEDHLDVVNALKKVDEKYRVVLCLRYFQDLPVKEIAEIINVPEGTVKSRIHQALKELRKVMSPENPQEVVK